MDGHDVVISILAFLGIVISQWTMFVIQYRKQHGDSKKLEDINDAVNHRHERGEGLKLYDLVLQNHSKTCECHDKTEDLIEWNQRQDKKIDALTVKVTALPCGLTIKDCPPNDGS